MNSNNDFQDFDVSYALSKNRLSGLWRLIRGFRLAYFTAVVCLGIGAVSKTLTFLLLRYFIDEVLGKGHYPKIVNNQNGAFILIGLGFLGLAAMEGSFTFNSGRLSAKTAESITRRLRNYLFDHIQRLTFAYHAQMQTGELIQRSTSDVDRG